MLEYKELGKHDFDGFCSPTEYGVSCHKFSVGIFQWVATASGTGLKRSAVKYRVYGLSADPEPVYEKAREICKKLDDGWEAPKKSETLKLRS